MAEKLQDKLACDTCASSDVELVALAGDDLHLLVALVCRMGHRTELRIVRKRRSWARGG